MNKELQTIIENEFDCSINDLGCLLGEEWKAEAVRKSVDKALVLGGALSSRDQIKTRLKIDPTEKLEQLLKEVRPHCQYWDCRDDVPLDENHANQVALICIEKQLELIRYLGSFKIEDLYDNLVEQKRILI